MGETAGPPQEGRRVVARCHQDHDAFGHDPAGDEAERIDRCRIDPVPIVDDHQKRLLQCRLRQHAERTGVDREPVACRRGIPEPERAGERCRLWGGNRRNDVRHRSQDRAQTRERQVRLHLESRGAQYEEPARRLHSIVKERAFADARIADDDQCRASSSARVRQECGDLLPLGRSADQDARNLVPTPLYLQRICGGSGTRGSPDPNLTPSTFAPERT